MTEVSQRSSEVGQSTDQLGQGKKAAAKHEKRGVCISGGGVRSAAFGLGAIQALQIEGELQKSSYISAVSGGGYIAGAWAMLKDQQPDRDPLLPGSPEVAHLRTRLDYLVGERGLFSRLAQVISRLMLNLTLAIALVFAIGYALGLAYRANARLAVPLSPGIRTDQLIVAEHISFFGMFFVAGAASFTAGLALAATSIWTERRATEIASKLSREMNLCLISGTVALIMGGALPLLVRELFGAIDTDSSDSTGILSGIAGLTVGGISSGIAVISAFKSVSGSGDPSPGRLTQLRTRVAPILLRLAILVLGAALVPLSALVLLLASIGLSFEAKLFTTPDAVWLVALLVVTTFILKAEPQVWSLHSIYRGALSDCFAISFGDEKKRPERMKPEDPLLRSWPESREGQPELLICATANIADYGEAATGRRGVPFIFSSEGAGIVQARNEIENQPPDYFSPALTELDAEPPGVGEELKSDPKESIGAEQSGSGNLPTQAWHPTSVPVAMAVAAAVVSPAMGKYSKPVLSSLLTVLNLRLGVWIRNPLVSRADLPKLFSMRYFIKELLGTSSVNDPLIYVTDGGHYENLGLAELLRRECREIWCVEASGDPHGSVSTLTSTMRIAEADFGIAWDQTCDDALDRLSASNADGGRRRVESTFATLAGRFWTPELGDYRKGRGRRFKVHVVKIGLSDESPAHLRAFQDDHPNFPYDSTINQRYTSELFDAYVALGKSSTQAALTAARKATASPN